MPLLPSRILLEVTRNWTWSPQLASSIHPSEPCHFPSAYEICSKSVNKFREKKFSVESIKVISKIFSRRLQHRIIKSVAKYYQHSEITISCYVPGTCTTVCNTRTLFPCQHRRQLNLRTSRNCCSHRETVSLPLSSVTKSKCKQTLKSSLNALCTSTLTDTSQSVPYRSATTAFLIVYKNN